MKQTKIFTVNGNSKIEGFNVGKYPEHHFYSAYSSLSENVFRYPLNIDFTGTDEWIKGCYRKRTNSELFAIEFIREGSMTYIQNGVKSIVEKDALFLVRRGTNNEVYMEEDNYCLKMTSSINGPLLEALLASLGLGNVDYIQISNPHKLEEIMREGIDELREKKDGFQYRCSEIAYRTLIQLGLEHKKSKYPPKLERALSFIERNIYNPISLNELCGSTGLSQPTLNRLFRKHIGTSPVDYFINQKMLIANQMLKNETMSIKEISQTLGYSNQLYFSAEFKKRHGQSPRDFRTKNIARH